VTVYTLFGQSGAPTLVVDAGSYTMGVQFSVSSPGCTLTGIWFYSAVGALNLPATIALYQVSGTSLVTSQGDAGSPVSWSGAIASGWVRAGFTSPPSLTASTAYKACVLGNVSGTSGNWYAATASYWSSGAGASGITSGPLSAPNDAGSSPGQDSFFSSTVLTYPDTSFNATNYWVDPEVTVSAVTAQPQFLVQGRSSRLAETYRFAR